MIKLHLQPLLLMLVMSLANMEIPYAKEGSKLNQHETIVSNNINNKVDVFLKHTLQTQKFCKQCFSTWLSLHEMRKWEINR